MMADGGEAPMDRGRSFFFGTIGSVQAELTAGGIREPTATHQRNGANKHAPTCIHSGRDCWAGVIGRRWRRLSGAFTQRVIAAAGQLPRDRHGSLFRAQA